MLQYLYLDTAIACPYIPIKGHHRAIKWTWDIDIDQIYSPVFNNNTSVSLGVELLKALACLG